KLHLLRALGNGDRLSPARAGEKNVIGECGLHEFADQLYAGVFGARDFFPRPEGPREIAQLFDFSRHDSPHLASDVRVTHHGITYLTTKGLRELGHVRYRSDDAILGDR